VLLIGQFLCDSVLRYHAYLGADQTLGGGKELATEAQRTLALRE
jgi:hypothetical protein